MASNVVAVPRRLVAALVAVLAIASLASCSSVDNQANVATLNGVSLSRADFDAWIKSPLGSTLLGSETTDGVVDGGAARSLLSVWAVTNLVRAVSGDQLDLAAAEKSMADAHPTTWAAAPAGLKQLATDYAAATALAQAGSLDQDALAEAAKRASVSIDPRLGRWDPDNVKVVSAG
jgi:hypothetical protein